MASSTPGIFTILLFTRKCAVRVSTLWIGSVFSNKAIRSVFANFYSFSLTLFRLFRLATFNSRIIEFRISFTVHNIRKFVCNVLRFYIFSILFHESLLK